MEGLKKSFLVRGNNIVGFSDKNFSTAPIGTVLAYAGNEAPRGYLLANGASYKVADYPNLYAVIGNTYGGDTENFNVPNLVDTVLTMVYIIKAFHTNEGVDSGVSDDVINYIDGEIAEVETELKGSIEEINDSLVDKQDFRIFKSLEEFNEKKGTSFTVVSGVDNMADIVNAMSNGEMLIITTKYITGSEIYFGLDSSTGWTKMFTFIKANGLCDVECRTTTSSIFKRVLNVDGVIGDWQELATITTVDGKDKVAHIKRFYSVPENDWNNAIEEGYYSIQNDEDANAIGNRPYEYALQIRVIRADTNDVNYAYQIAYVSSEDTSIYIRRQKRDGTWLPWGKVCITSVADVGVTTITPVNSNITGNIEYEVKNGICYVSFKNVNSTTNDNDLSISTTMPKSSINCGFPLIATGKNGNIGFIYINKNTTKLNGNFWISGISGSCSFSYPVAEN